MSRPKAFFLNGGAGRILCSIPALEKYEEESGDDDFIIVCEGGTDMFKGHPKLDSRTYDNWQKNLFKEKLIMRDVVSPEPYRIWEYYNQKCNLAQAFDIEINNKGIRDLPKPTLRLNKDELIQGRQLVSEVKVKLNKRPSICDKTVVNGLRVSFAFPTMTSFPLKILPSCDFIASFTLIRILVTPSRVSGVAFKGFWGFLSNKFIYIYI